MIRYGTILEKKCKKRGGSSKILCSVSVLCNGKAATQQTKDHERHLVCVMRNALGKVGGSGETCEIKKYIQQLMKQTKKTKNNTGFSFLFFLNQ